MDSRAVGAEQVRSFAHLFVDERSHFYLKRPGQTAFIHQARTLTDDHIREHLRGRYWVAVTRADATRILSLDLDCKAGPDPEGEMLKRYDRIRRLMPEPLVFQSSHSHGLHLYWLLAEEVPTEPAVSLLARTFAEHGVQVGRGTCEIRPTTGQCLRLPFGAESALLVPDNLTQYGHIGADPAAAIDHLVRNTRRCKADDILDRLTHGGRQLSFPQPASSRPAGTVATTMLASPTSTVPARPPEPGLTQREMAVLWHLTTPLEGLTRYRHMQFLFDVALAFKASGTDTLALPKRKLVQMAGAHSGTYQERLDFAESVGLLKCANYRRARRQPRRFKLGMQFDGPGDIHTLPDGLQGRDLDFLSARTRCKTFLDARSPHA